MTISWSERRDAALQEALRLRTRAKALPMRTHARKRAFELAQHWEREAAFAQSKEPHP